jgi:hypothetical protein
MKEGIEENRHGLGTIIHEGDVFLTHNHTPAKYWAEADYLWFTNYEGDRERVEMDETQYLHSDPGTRAFRLPFSLRGTPAPLGNPNELSVGDAVQVVYYNKETSQLSVAVGRIFDDSDEFEGVPTVIAELSTITINRGDSGGPLFKDGRLVGNTWSFVEFSTDEGDIMQGFRSAKLPVDLQ